MVSFSQTAALFTRMFEEMPMKWVVTDFYTALSIEEILVSADITNYGNPVSALNWRFKLTY
jgi:hypothetical protein